MSTTTEQDRALAERLAADFMRDGASIPCRDADRVLTYGERIRLVLAGLTASRQGEPERIRVAQREALTRFAVVLEKDAFQSFALRVYDYLDRAYPDPAPSVVLTNGERVTFDGSVRYRGWTWVTVAGFLQRDNEKGYVLTDSEIRELLALAATVEGR